MTAKMRFRLMPKAKPLPDDPIERAKIIKQRAATVKKVAAWKKRNAHKARIDTRYCVALHRQRAKRRAELLAA